MLDQQLIFYNKLLITLAYLYKMSMTKIVMPSRNKYFGIACGKKVKIY